jgi:hypothetical protein
MKKINIAATIIIAVLIMAFTISPLCNIANAANSNACTTLNIIVYGPSPEFTVSLQQTDGTFYNEYITSYSQLCLSNIPSGNFLASGHDYDAQCSGGTRFTYNGGSQTVYIYLNDCYK